MNEYEQATATYLQHLGVLFSRVSDDARLEGLPGPQKNFDFLVPIVPGRSAWGLLLEIKGRRFSAKKRFENWVTGTDLDSLAFWEAHFGPDHLGLLCFAYRCDDDTVPARPWSPVERHGIRYGLMGTPLNDYRKACRRRSPKWDTWTVPRARFEEMASPLESFLPPADPLARHTLPTPPPPVPRT